MTRRLTDAEHDARATRGTPPPFDNQPDLACRQPGINPEMFFTDEPTARHAAIRVCRTCPHTTACLDWAITTRQNHGILGAATPHERHHIRRTQERT